MNQMGFVPRHPPPSPVSFSGDRAEFFRLAARGAGLELVTVGFYRFWLVTDIRRHLWSNTHIDGDAAEYTGRARELLIGFLIAMAIIVPVYLAYFIASLEAEHLRAFASFPLLGFFYLFGQFAVYRAVIFASRSLVTASHSRQAEQDADTFAIDIMRRLGRSPKPMGELMFRVTGKEANGGLSFLANHPLTEDRLARMSKEDRPPGGPPLLTASEWASLKSICSSGTKL